MPTWPVSPPHIHVYATHGTATQLANDSRGQKCATSPRFLGFEARAATNVLLASIREGEATIDPREVLECAVLLDHGRWLALLISEHATYGVDKL